MSGYGSITKKEAERRKELAKQGIKVCSTCKRELSFDNFQKDKHKKDGLQSKCKDCMKIQNQQKREYYRKYREEHWDEIKARNYKYYLEHKEQRKKYNEKHKEKFAKCKKINDHLPHNRYKLYLSNAQKRNIPFNITFEEFKKITELPCYYCGGIMNTEGVIYNGIDRVDSSKAYSLDNIVPCCNMCNKMKLNYELDVWLNQIKKIALHTLNLKE